jgi:hypothetical protein
MLLLAWNNCWVPAVAQMVRTRTVRSVSLEQHVHSIIYLVGLIVVILFILSALGLR